MDVTRSGADGSAADRSPLPRPSDAELTITASRPARGIVTRDAKRYNRNNLSLLRFASYRNIARDVADRLAARRESSEPLAPWEEEVIVPSRGMAEAIGAELLSRLPSGTAGLQIRFLEELAGDLVTRASVDGIATPIRVASPAERRLAMRTAARASTHPMMESRGVATMLERSFRDVRDSAVPFELFARKLAEARVRNPARLEEIVRVWSDYATLVARLGASDPADLFEAASRLANPAVKPQLVAGFYDMTGAQLAFVRKLHEAGKIAAIWVPSAAPFVEPFVRSFGGELPERIETPLSAPAVTVTTFETRLVELQTVCRRIAVLLSEGVPPSSIGIVARSFEPYDAALIERFAADCGFRTTLGVELPLITHRIGRAAVTLLRIRERNFPRGDVLELLRDGLRVERRTDIDALDVATRQAQIAGGTSAELQPFVSRRRELADYVAVVSELEALTAEIDPSLLSRLGSLFRVESERDLEAASKLDDVAALFASASRWKRGFEVAAAIDAIENESLTPPDADLPPGAPLIRVADVMRARGRSFTHLFVVKMQDDLFPQRRTDDPLLPDSDRQRLGVRAIGDGRAEEQLLFEIVSAAGSEAVHFSNASGDGFGKVMRPSRFLRELGDAQSPPTPAPRRGNAPRRRALQLLARAGSRSPFDGYVTTIHEQVRSRLESISPTQLEDYGECPQKFFYKHVLGVRDFDDPEHELQINARDKGILDHRILERFYRATPPDEIRAAAIVYPDLPAALAERLATIIDEEFARREEESPPFNRTMRAIEQRATHRILRDFVIHDLAELNTTALVPRRFEYRFGRKHREKADHPEPFAVEAGGVAINVEGTIDRVDQNADGRYRIVDYKSGRALRHKNLGRKIERGVRLQLALYAMAVADFFTADPAKVSGTIKPIVTDDINPAHYAFELGEQRDALLETLDVFVTSILAGHFPAFPTENDEINSCRYCPVNQSCRTRHDADERRSLEDASDALALLSGRRSEDAAEERE